MEQVFKVILPGWSGSGLPQDYPLHVRVALRSSMIVVHIFSISKYGLPFGLISERKKTTVITKLYGHRVAAIRNLVHFWKLVAFMTDASK